MTVFLTQVKWPGMTFSSSSVGTVSRMLLPTDGLWRGAMHSFQDPSALVEFGGADVEAFPFLGVAPLTVAYLLWAAIWVAS